MSSTSNPGFQEPAKLKYIATAPFNNELLTYTVTFNATTLQNVGTLVPNPNATAANCPRGRILRANGKRLYPGANPGVTTFLIGVYDSQSLLSGFIDPNNYMFAVFNADKPQWLPDTVDFPLDGLGLQRGQPVFTTGDVIAGKQIYSTGVTAIGPYTATAAVLIDPSLGQTITFTVTPAGAGSTYTLTLSGTVAQGSLVRLFITQVGTNVSTYASSANIKLSTAATLTSNSATKILLTLFSPDGVTLYEVSRSTGMA